MKFHAKTNSSAIISTKGGFSTFVVMIVVGGLVALLTGGYFVYQQFSFVGEEESLPVEAEKIFPEEPFASEPAEPEPSTPSPQPPSPRPPVPPRPPTSGSGFFPIGMYCVENQNDFADLDKGGFNLMQFYQFEGVDTATDEEARAYLDGAHRLGMQILMGIQQEAVLDKRLDIIEKRIKTLKDHPALFGWQLFDEPENTRALSHIYGRDVTVSPTTFQQIYKLIKSIDPIHPVTSVAATGLDESYEYLSGVDTQMLQYGAPPPGLYDYPWDSLENLMPLLKSDALFLVAKGKSFILNTAAYNPANDSLVWPKDKPKSLGRYPTKEEIRLVAYYSLIQGGSGVIINCYRFPAIEGFGAEDISSTSPIPEGRKQWQVVSSIASELKEMSPILLAPNSDKRVVIEPENSGVEFIVKEHGGRIYVIAANPSSGKKAVTFTTSFPPSSVTVRNETRTIPLEGNAFRDTFTGYGVHVYEISR